MTKRWRIHSHASNQVASLGRAAGVSAILAQLFLCRGISDPEAVRRFLALRLSDLRSPEELPGCAAAAARIWEAVGARRRIVVYGDYDVDGISGTALLWRCLRLLGANVGYYLPHRIDEGYGLHSDALRRLAAEKASLIVTVDCGISAVEEAQTARQCGLELIVTDHHTPSDPLPDAAAIVHPRLPGTAYPFGGLSGSGVALKLAWAICQVSAGAKRVSPVMRDYLLSAVGLAALGTVADMVPLVDENRVLVHHGLESLKRSPSIGLAALMKIAKLDDKPALDAEDIGFMLAPRLNAAGRLGQGALAAELLMTDRPDRALELAAYIDGLNASRQTLERSIYLAANKQIKERFDPEGDAAFVLADRGWHPGVLGIVAGRLAEKYHRPVVLVALDQLGTRPPTGSARSVPGLDLHAALAACGEHLLGHGGHAAAAGLSVDERKIDLFRECFVDHVAGLTCEEHRTAELLIDAESPLSAFTPQTVQDIERMAPFGHGNSRPLVCASGVEMAESPKMLGKSGRHMAMKLRQHNVAFRAVAFGVSDRAEELLGVDGPLDVAFHPVINTFRGNRSVELRLVDWRTSRVGG
jgi:single-stranded-DNA-specific exonuclease